MFSWTTTVYLSIFPPQMEAIILCTVYAVKNSGKNEIPLCNHTFYQGLDIHSRTLVHCVRACIELYFSHAFAAVSRCVRCVISAHHWPRRSNTRTQKTQKLYVIRVTARHYFQEKWKKNTCFDACNIYFLFRSNVRFLKVFLVSICGSQVHLNYKCTKKLKSR